MSVILFSLDGILLNHLESSESGTKDIKKNFIFKNQCTALLCLKRKEASLKILNKNFSK